LDQREDKLDKKSDIIDKRELSLQEKEELLNSKHEKVSSLHQEAEELVEKQQRKLEEVAELSRDDAKAIILKKTEDSLAHDEAVMIKESEEKAKEEADRKAKNLVAQ